MESWYPARHGQGRAGQKYAMALKETISERRAMYWSGVRRPCSSSLPVNVFRSQRRKPTAGKRDSDLLTSGHGPPRTLSLKFTQLGTEPDCRPAEPRSSNLMWDGSLPLSLRRAQKLLPVPIRLAELSSQLTMSRVRNALRSRPAAKTRVSTDPGNTKVRVMGSCETVGSSRVQGFGTPLLESSHLQTCVSDV